LSAKDSLVTRSPAVDQSAITRAVTVPAGRFAPGHLGELTQQVPFEMADAVLEETCRVQRRVRDLPARVVACLLPAGCLFAELGYSHPWRRLTAGPGGLPAAVPTASAMTQARRRLGPGPLRELLALVSCGTRTVIGAVFGPVTGGETTCAPGLLASLHAGMVLLADRGFGAGHP
jgi:Insertion element 4 transposase N-terminal